MNENNKKILLVLLPFWTPLIPPIGIACLKSFLKNYGYEVKTVDATVEEDFQHSYDLYFNILRESVPENKRGNFYSLGHDVLRNQMMAHLQDTHEEEYIRLVKTLIYKTFYVDVPDRRAIELKDILDAFYNRVEVYIVDLLAKETPSVLGLSVFSDTLPASLFAFRKTRERFPAVKTVMGGGVFADLLAPGSPNLETFLEKTKGFIDKIFIGEGELLFLKWLSGELPEEQRVYTLTDTGCKSLDLAAADAPDLEDFDARRYPYMVSYTSRSCPFQCSFCSETIQWGKYRKKDVSQIVREMVTLSQRHHISGSPLFLLSDSLLNPVIDDLSEAFLKQETGIYWSGWLRVDKPECTAERALRWRHSGFYHARIGAESGSPRVLELMGKKITPGQIKTAVFNLANAGIKTTTLWVIGHPGETEEDFRETLDLIEELRHEIYEAECRPFYYYLTGQAGSADDWWANTPKIPLYPETADPLLMLQTWLLDCEPSREETYRRVNRFAARCRELDIPNPYSIQEIYRADERWKQLQKNAVPALVDLNDMDGIFAETKKIKKLNAARKVKTGSEDGDFVF